MPMSEFYGPVDLAACVRTVRRAVDLGVTFFDTAAAFGAKPHGEAANEEFLGQALRGLRDEVVLATKFGVRRVDGRLVVDNSPAHIRRSIDASLSRLGTDRIDLVHQIAAVQSEYSLMSRQIEEDLLPVARELGAGLVAYAPLGRALLTSEWQREGIDDPHDLRYSMPRFRRSNLRRNRELVGRIEPLAAQLDCSIAQLALAWLLAKGDDIIPIPGTRKVGHLEDNLGACGLRLTADQLSLLDRVFRPHAVAGERNSPDAIALMSLES